MPAPSADGTGWLGVLRSARTGARFAGGAALGMWLGDTVVIAVSHGQATAPQWLMGSLAALFVALSSALVLGAALGPAVVPLTTQALGMLAPKWGRLRRDGHEAMAAGLTILVALGLWSWLAYRAFVGIALHFSRPETTAGAEIVVSWILAASLVLVLPSCHRRARLAVDVCARVPGLHWLFAQSWRVAVFAAAIVLAVAAALIRAYRQELSTLPLRYAVSLAGLVVGLMGAAYRVHDRGPRFARARSGALILPILLAAFGAAIAIRLRPEANTVHTIAFTRALSGRLGYAAWTAAFDFDRDGQLSLFGGGDCAPFDPHRYTGAVEIPGNGVDEDCDGADLTMLPIAPRPHLRSGSLPKAPIFVLVSVDGLGARRLQSLGNAKPLMPHLDALAGSSMLFTRCFSQGPSTRLSFPSMFTSRYDSQLAFEVGPKNPYSWSASERQLQDVLDDAGYETVAVIPQDYFDRSRWPSVTRGFQRIDRSAFAFGMHNAPQVTDAALRVLSEQHTRPLYMWVHYYDAHAPYLAVPGIEYPSKTDEALYEGELHYIDGEIERLISAFDQRSEPRYLFVTADHGTVFHPDPASRRAHYGFDLYSATLHVPLIVHGPWVQPGRSDTLVSTMDIAPTIADLLRIGGGQFEGSSLMPELLTGSTDPHRFIFHEFYLPERLFHGYEPLEIASVHSGQWNLILNRVRGTYELYDFLADYFEQSDLYEELAQSPGVMHLKALLGTFIAHSDSAALARAPQTPDRLFKSSAP